MYDVNKKRLPSELTDEEIELEALASRECLRKADRAAAGLAEIQNDLDAYPGSEFDDLPPDLREKVIAFKYGSQN